MLISAQRNRDLVCGALVLIVTTVETNLYVAYNYICFPNSSRALCIIYGSRLMWSIRVVLNGDYEG